MRANPILTNFTSGELSPRLSGRVDVTKYFNGCQVLENFIVMPHGGVDRRPGVRYVADGKHSNMKVRLVPFEFSTTQAYVLEFGHNYIRVYKDGGQVTSGGSPVEVTTTYTEDELFELQFAQSADTLYIAHPNHKPASLTRSSHTSWTLSDLSFTAATKARITGATKANPCVITAEGHGFVNGNVVYISDVAGMTQLNGNYYTVANKTTDTFQLQGVDSTSYDTYTSGGFAQRAMTGATKANPCVITCVKHDFEDGDLVYISGVSGMTELNGNVYVVTNVTNDTFALKDCNSTSYGTYTSGGVPAKSVFSKTGYYPSCVAFFEQRLCWAAPDERPQTIWASVSGDYLDYTFGVNDDDAFSYTIVSDRVNRIRWMVPSDFLFLGTVGGEFRFGGSSSSDPVTPTSVNAKRQSTYGSKNLQAILIGDAVVYVQRSGKKVRELVYSFERDKYRSKDTTILAEHITRTSESDSEGIVQIAYQQDPDSILWAVRDDGQLLGMTYEPDQQVYGWHRHVFTDGVCESVAVIPGASEDEVWVSVYWNGKRRIGYMNTRDFGDQRDAFFVDLGLTWDGGDPVTVTGASNTNPVVITAPSHGFSDGYNVRIQNVLGMTELNGNTYTVANATADTFELQGIDGAGYGEWVDPEEDDDVPCVERVENTFSGASHLALVECAVYGDGGAIGNITPDASGGFVAPSYYNTLHIGLPYSSVIVPMKFEAGATLGTAQGEVQRVHRLAVKVYKSLPFQYGSSEDDLHDLPFEVNSELYSGDLSIEFDGGYDFPQDVYIVQSLPNPLTVLSIMPKLETVE